MSGFSQTVGTGMQLLPVSTVSQLLAIVPQAPAIAFASDAGVWYAHAGTSINQWQPIGNPTLITGYPAKVTLSQNALNISSTQTTNLIASTYNSQGSLLTGRSYTATSSNTGACTVGTIVGNVIPIIGVAAGTSTIQVTDVGSGISTLCVVTVTTATSNRPAGMTTVIQTGSISLTTAQLQASTFTLNGQVWNNLSNQAGYATTYSSVGESALNISAASGGGIQVNYNTNLAGGNSPVRVGMGFSTPGTGYLYVAYTVWYVSNYTQNSATGTKQFEPRWISSNVNHVLSATYDATNNPNIQQEYLFLQNPSVGQSQNVLPSSSTIGIITGGAQHFIEWSLTPESTPGAGNGIIQQWCDGALCINYPSAKFLQSGYPVGFNYFLMDPTYGGGGSVPYAMWWAWNNLVVAVK